MSIRTIKAALVAIVMLTLGCGGLTLPETGIIVGIRLRGVAPGSTLRVRVHDEFGGDERILNVCTGTDYCAGSWSLTPGRYEACADIDSYTQCRVVQIDAGEVQRVLFDETD